MALQPQLQAAMAAASAPRRPLLCLQIKAVADKVAPPPPPEIDQIKVNPKVVLQPRVCTLRSYGDYVAGGRGAVIKANVNAAAGGDQVSRFFDILTDYVDNSKKSHDFEIISGRLAMIVFAATVGMEIATGNSVFRKMDVLGMEEAAGICLAAVTSAAVFAWVSSNRTRVGRIFSTSCNTFIESLIDHIIDGLFYETDIEDWSDEI